MHKVKVP